MRVLDCIYCIRLLVLCSEAIYAIEVRLLLLGGAGQGRYYLFYT